MKYMDGSFISSQMSSLNQSVLTKRQTMEGNPVDQSQLS